MKAKLFLLFFVIFSILSAGAQTAPTIQQVVPQKGNVGSTVKIYGTGFSNQSDSNRVFFGSIAAKAVWASDTKGTYLQTTVPLGATSAPIQVTVNKRSCTSSSAFIVTFAKSYQAFNYSSFSSLKDSLIGGEKSHQVITADINGDGTVEFVVSYETSSFFTVVNTKSTSKPQNFVTDAVYKGGTNKMHICDIDGDGKPDVAITRYGFNTGVVSVYRNTSTIDSISFAAESNFVIANFATDLALGDLNNDGKPDLLVTNGNYGSNNYSLIVLKNTSNDNQINFTEAGQYNIGSFSRSICISDLNNDGKADVAVAAYLGNNIYILKNNCKDGDIVLEYMTNINSGNTPVNLKCADLDGDGKNDLICANLYYSSTLSIFKNTSIDSGNITFTSRFTIPNIDNPNAIAVNDFNGDGLMDLAVSSNNYLNIFKNKSSANGFLFENEVMYNSNSTISDISTGDFNSDGRTDIGFVSFSGFGGLLSWMTATDVQRPVITSISPLIAKPGDKITINGVNFSNIPIKNSVFFGGIRADSFVTASLTKLEVIVPKSAPYGHISVTVNALTALSPLPFNANFVGGTGNFNSNSFVKRTDTLMGGPSTALIANLNKDSLPDIIIPHLYSPNKIGIFNYRNSPATLISNTNIATAGGIIRTQFADVNGDGFTDLLQSNSDSGMIYIYKNPANTNISWTKTGIKVMAQPQTFAIGDADNDGKPDLFVVGNGASIINVYKNTTFKDTMAFVLAGSFNTPANVNGIALTDLDDDGKQDICVISTSQSMATLRNLSSVNSISFAAKQEVSTSGIPYQIKTGDFDSDGKTDLAVVTSSNAYLSVYKNKSSIGVINMTTKTDIFIGDSRAQLAIGDLDGDGKPDIAVNNSTSTVFSLFRNMSDTAIKFAPKTDITTGNTSGYTTESIAIHDVTGDNKPDIILSTWNNRVFVYSNETGTVLPTQLLYFTAQPTQNQQTILQWGISNSTALASFVLEKQINQQFTPIASISSSVNRNNFSYVVSNEQAYYRLRLLNIDGSSSYSPVLLIGNESAKSVRVYPNPTSHYLMLEGASKGFTIHALGSGKILLQQQYVLQKLKRIDVSQLAAGNYVVTYSLPNGTTAQQLFTKQ